MISSSNQWQQKLFYLALMFSGVPIRIIGDIYLGEIILLIYSIDLYFSKTKVFIGKYWQSLPKLFLLWGVANLFSSIANGKTLELGAVAVFTVVLTFSSLYAMIGFARKYSSSLKTVGLLFVLGRLAGVLIFPNSNSETLLWKFGIGEWVILLTILIMTISGKSRVFLSLLFLCAIFSFFNEARTLGMLSLLVIIFSTVKLKRKSSAGFVGVMTILTLPIIYFLYIQMANNDLLGDKEFLRAQILATSEIGPLAARTEFVFSSQAFLQSPLYGLGFDPKVNSEIIYSGYNWLSQHGVIVGTQLPTKLPLHSFVMSAFVQGGIFAGLFWVMTIVFAIRQLLTIAEYEQTSRALLVYVAFSLINRVMFSPFGAYERLNTCFFLLIIFILSESKMRSSEVIKTN